MRATGGGVGHYVYPAAAAGRPHAPRTVGGQAMSYDAVGNLVSGRGRAIAWAGQNRPMQVTRAESSSASVTASLVYDPDGERLRRTVQTAPQPGCPAPPAAVTLTLGPDVERSIGWACVNGAWVSTTTWTSRVTADVKVVRRDAEGDPVNKSDPNGHAVGDTGFSGIDSLGTQEAHDTNVAQVET